MMQRVCDRWKKLKLLFTFINMYDLAILVVGTLIQLSVFFTRDRRQKDKERDREKDRERSRKDRDRDRGAKDKNKKSRYSMS